MGEAEEEAEADLEAGLEAGGGQVPDLKWGFLQRLPGAWSMAISSIILSFCLVET